MWNVLCRTVTHRTIFKHFSEKSPTSHVARHLSGPSPLQVLRIPTSPSIKPGSYKDERGWGGQSTIATNIKSVMDEEFWSLLWGLS